MIIDRLHESVLFIFKRTRVQNTFCVDHSRIQNSSNIIVCCHWIPIIEEPINKYFHNLIDSKAKTFSD